MGMKYLQDVDTSGGTSDNISIENVKVDSIEIKKRGTVKILCVNGDELMAFAESGDVKILAQWLKSGDKVITVPKE